MSKSTLGHLSYNTPKISVYSFGNIFSKVPIYCPIFKYTP